MSLITPEQRRRVLRLFLSVFCLILAEALLPVPAGAKNLHPLWERANAFYKHKAYDSAAGCYEQINSSHVENAALFYNLGNCYYRLNRIGKAVLYYERALHLDPDNGRIKDNLTLAQARVSLPVSSAKPVFFIVWWNHLVHLAAPQLWAWLTFALFLASLVLVYLLRSGKAQMAYPGRWLSFLIAGLMFTATMFYFSYQAAVSSDKAVVMFADTPFLQNPGPQGTPSGQLPEGTVVRVREQRNGYYAVILPNGGNGWISENALEKVTP